MRMSNPRLATCLAHPNARPTSRAFVISGHLQSFLG